MMEGGVAAMDSRPYLDDDDGISYDSDSSGDSKLRKIMERKLLAESGVTPTRAPLPVSSDLRDGVPTESPGKHRRNSKERRRPQPSSLTSNSPISYSWYYNQRDYSPSVSSVTPQKAIITSWMDAMMRTPIEQDLQVDDDDISIDSVEQLEQVAAQIRSEIRQLELKELADEAEIAAEAGQESFAGRASTFGDSASSLGDVDRTELRPSSLKRRSTYSEGTSLLKQVRPARAKPKIRCLQLRDVNEVIPSIGELHSNLRTHLMLAGVETQSLESKVMSESENRAAHRARAVKSPVQFLSSLKSWVSTSPPPSEPRSTSTDVASNTTTPRKTTVKSAVDSKPKDPLTSKSSDTMARRGSFEVGGMLSQHIHEPKAVRRSPIRIPSGLDLPEDLCIPHELPSKILLNDADVDTVETAPTSSSSQQDDVNPDQNNRESACHELEELTPIVLFEQMDDDDEQSPGEGIECDDVMGPSSLPMLMSSPTEKDGEQWHDASASNMFVTPNRLRGIRKASRQLASRRSLRHQSADLGWTLKVVKLRHTKSDPESLCNDDDPLDMPVLSVMSEDRGVLEKDGSLAVAPLPCSEDVSIASLPENVTSKVWLRSVDSSCEGYQGKESRAKVVPKLDRPLSLSFDEYKNLTDAAESDLASDSSKRYTAPKGQELNKSCGGCREDHQSAIQTTLSHDLSLNIGPSDEIEVANAAGALVAIEAVDASGDALGSENDVSKCDERSSHVVPSEALSVIGGPPLMPLLEKTDDPLRVNETSSIDFDVDTSREGMRSLSSVVLPRIDKRASFNESAHDISEIEINNDSILSLQLDDLFETEKLCKRMENGEVNALQDTGRDDASVDGHAGKDTDQEATGADCVSEKSELNDPSMLHAQSAYSEIALELHSRGMADTEMIARIESSPHAKGELDPRPDEANATELPFDEKEQVPTNDSPVCENQLDEQIPDDGLAIESPLLREIGVASPESAEIEVSEIVDVESNNSQNDAPGYTMSEEIVKSPSGRVRVTMIEQSLHEHDSDGDDDDDDVVHSENDSVLTPQSHPCECLLNVARQFEENVSSDLVEASPGAHARYDLFMPALNQQDAKVSIDSAASAFPTNTLQEQSSPKSSIPEAGRDEKRLTLRRALSCPNFIATEVDTSIDSFITIPHKRDVEARRRTGPLSVSDRGFNERNRRQLIHASSLLDPCQSASPFRETMDDMMKNFSPKRTVERERRERELANENRDFLHNYLYCSKPSSEPTPHARGPNMCGEHCDFMSGVLDTYRSIVPIRSSSGNDMFSLNAGVDETFPPVVSETWFDVASEHFDGALERVMGSAHAQSKRWNSMFEAPSLKSKRESRQPRAPRASNDVQGIVLVRQSSTTDSQDGEISEEQFESMYGMKREEFVQLPVTERSRLHDKAHENLRLLISRPSSQRAPGAPSRPPRSPATSTRSLSSSDLPEMHQLI